jgi:hypothetical protein
MGRRPGFEYTRFPVEDSLESLGALCHTIAERYEQGRPLDAEIHFRMARALWQVAEAFRQEKSKAA